MTLVWDRKDRVDTHDGGYHRERSDQLYHTPRWTRLSRAFRASHPLCERCRQNGLIRASECVDHVIPWPHCQEQGFGFYDERNLQALCLQCNAEKGHEDQIKYKTK